jgi:hypothetical protein
MIAPRSVIVTEAATIQHQNRIRVALLGAKRCQLRLELADCAVLRRESFSLHFRVFDAAGSKEKRLFEFGGWTCLKLRKDNQTSLGVPA